MKRFMHDLPIEEEEREWLIFSPILHERHAQSELFARARRAFSFVIVKDDYSSNTIFSMCRFSSNIFLLLAKRLK